MNYYERIQNSLYYIEANLDNELTVEGCAKEAFMSVSGYYRMFLSLVGFSVKEYIRLRRLTLAFFDLQESERQNILDIAVRYYYNSADSFTRAFKKQFGILPSRVRTEHNTSNYLFMERMNIMEKYFETESKELLEKYPDIKVIRELPDQKVACYTFFGPAPEENAFAAIKKWVQKNKISLKDSAYRVFGYNNPDPSVVEDPDELYGYEVCVTIPDDLYDTLPEVPAGFLKGTYDSVKRKILKGGKYAVMSVRRDATGDIGMNIMHAWQRFLKWLEESKYIFGGNQYLEEHLGFDEQDDPVGGVELYMSVAAAPKQLVSEKKELLLSSFRAAVFREEGENGEELPMLAFNRAFTFAKKHGLSTETSRVFDYNKGFDHRPPFFHVVLISLPDGFCEEDCADENVIFQTFEGGKFMSASTDFAHLADTWYSMELWKKETKAKIGKQQWLEEYKLKDFSFPPEDIIVCYPIR